MRKFRVIKCEFCSKEYSWISNLKHHIKTVHELQQSNVCPECDKKISYQNFFNDCNHTGQKPYKSSFCEKYFSQACNLKRHKISSHSKNFPHKCSVCSKHDNLF